MQTDTAQIGATHEAGQGETVHLTWPPRADLFYVGPPGGHPPHDPISRHIPSWLEELVDKQIAQGKGYPRH